MLEKQPTPNLIKVSGLPRERQCLKDPQYECTCSLSDPDKRLAVLKKLRQDLGIYSNFDLLNEKNANYYEQKKRKLCEGHIPTFFERVKTFFKK